MTTDGYASLKVSSYSRWLSWGMMVKTWNNCLWKVLYLACIM